MATHYGYPTGHFQRVDILIVFRANFLKAHSPSYPENYNCSSIDQFLSTDVQKRYDTGFIWKKMKL